jgi:putative glutamine amidotransferase
VDAPLIGVTTSELRRKEDVRPTPQGEPPAAELALGLTYLKALAAAGAIPVVLPPLEGLELEPLLDRLAGVCLAGGPDLSPSTYGAEPHGELGPTEPEADGFEIELARLAWDRDLPILAICRGSQTLNVARGGTLIQHLPELEQVTIEHRQTEAGDVVTHEVEVVAGSRLADLVGTHLEVNSFHHQALDRLGDGLRVVAHSPDGVIEGIEATDRRFCVGVQWHAECLTSRPEQARLFEGLAEAAAGPPAGHRARIRVA